MHRDNLKAWSIPEENFPYKAVLRTQIEFLLGYAILAPSTFNSQPWKCSFLDNKLQVFLDTSRMPRKSDKTGRFAYMSIGCFIENLLISAHYFGLSYKLSLELITEGNMIHIATISFSGKTEATSNEKLLFKSIPKRVTNRSLYLSKTVPEDILKSIIQMTNDDQKVALFDKKFTEAICDISSKADFRIWSDNEFRKEHVGWVRNNLTKLYDGMPAYGVGIRTIPSFFAKPIILSRIFPKIQASKNIKSLKSTQNYAMILSDSSPIQIVKVGMLFERISLYLTSIGLSAAPMGQFIEDHVAQESLKETVAPKETKMPQLFFRIGYPSKKTPHSPRIPVKNILLNNTSNAEEKLIDTINVPIVLKKVVINNYEVNYAVAGEGPPLLLLHGINIGWGQWHLNMEMLSKYFTVYAIDLPGSGSSAKIDFKLFNFSNDFINTIEEFIKHNELKDLSIIGHSLGASVAIKTVAKRPELFSKIVLVSPLGMSDYLPPSQRLISIYYFAWFLAHAVFAPTKNGIKKFLLSIVKDHHKLQDEFIEYFYEGIGKDKLMHPIYFMHNLSKNFKLKKEVVFVDELYKIKNPILILLGEEDKILEKDKIISICKRFPNISLHIYKQSGHVLYMENSERFNEEVLNFLRTK